MVDTRLKTFLTLLEEKNYTNVAKKLYITQPAVTQHIKSLEKDNNITIFRNPKTFELTKAGKLLQEYAEIAVKEFNQFKTALSKQIHEMVINFGISPMLLHALYDKFDNVFSNSNAKINYYELSNNEIFDKLTNGELDFALIDSSFDSAKFDSFVLINVHLIAIVNSKGKFLDVEKIDKNKFNESICVMAGKETGLNKITKEALGKKNVIVENGLCSNNVDLMIKQIIDYDAIGFIYDDCVRKYMKDGSVKKINALNIKASQNIYLIYSRNAFFDSDTIELIENLKKTMDSSK